MPVIHAPATVEIMARQEVYSGRQSVRRWATFIVNMLKPTRATNKERKSEVRVLQPLQQKCPPASLRRSANSRCIEFRHRHNCLSPKK